MDAAEFLEDRVHLVDYSERFLVAYPTLENLFHVVVHFFEKTQIPDRAVSCKPVITVAISRAFLYLIDIVCSFFDNGLQFVIILRKLALLAHTGKLHGSLALGE